MTFSNDRSRRVFLAGLRDRMRAPVSAVIEYSELLLEDAQEQGRIDLIADLTKIRLLGRKLFALVEVGLDEAVFATAGTEREREALNSNLRHELRTPLNAIIGYSELLIEDAAVNGAAALIPDLEKIRGAGRQFLCCIDEIAGLVPAGLEAGSAVAAPSATGAMVRSVIEEIPSLDGLKPGFMAEARGNLLVVDDTEISRDLMRRQLERQGHRVTAVGSGQQALDILRSQTFDLVLLDLMMPDMSGYQVLRRLAGSAVSSDTPVIVVSALDDMDSVVQCVRMGAEDYLVKPFNHVLLKARIRTCLENKRLRHLSDALESRNLREEVPLIAASRSMQKVLQVMRSVSRNPVNVHLRGESGSGKEVVARLIHLGSDRAAKPFVAVNCAAIPANLMESEFFGYEKGAFTGAAAGRGGYFEEADGGTLFLDEIGDMPPAIQPKFLRIIQEGEGSRLGSAKTLRYDLRIISASNKDLRQEVAAGRFREDLFYRIFSVDLPIPPLRERREDIEPLTLFFLNKVQKRFHKKLAGPSPELLALFGDYSWPGNIRQLLHEVEHLVALTPEGQRISPKYCSEELRRVRSAGALAHHESTRSLSLAKRVEELEVTSIKEALRRTRGNKVQASKLLGITRQGLDKKMKRLKIAGL